MSDLYPEGLGRVHSLESFGTVDGPGIRFVVFMQGCLFRCLYCHNPDSIPLERGHLMTSEEILDAMERNGAFYNNGGGLTVSGGEPLLQAPFIAELFEKAQAHGWHTCLDTNGYHDDSHREYIEKTFLHSNLVMLDIKHMDPERHQLLTSRSVHYSLETALWLESLGVPLRIRHVVVPGWTDQPIHAQKLLEFIAPLKNLKEIELLPFHQLGKEKWKQEGWTYPLEDVPEPSQETMNAIKKVFEDQGIKTID